MIKTTLKFSVFVLLAGFFVFSAAAQERTMYSYTDENGTVVFTDKRPQGQDYQKQAIPAGPPPQGGNPYAQAAQAEPSSQEPSAGQLRREEITANRRAAREEQAQREAQCTAWQAEVDNLEPHRRHFYTNDEGETVRMDDVERVNRVAELKEKIASNCT